MTEEMKTHKQYAFEEFFKTVLRNKARNLHKKLNTIEQHEAAAADFEADVFDAAAAEDTYQLEARYQFVVKEQKILVTDSQLGQAISFLLPKYRDVLLLAYFMEWSDSKIAQYLHLPVSTVHDRRQQALHLLRQRLELQHGT